MSDQPQTIVLFRKALFKVERVRYGVQFSMVWLFAIGITTLVSRALYEPDIKLFLIVTFAGLLTAYAASTICAYKEVPSESSLVAYLDKYNNCGGLLISQDEINLGKWSTNISALTFPTPQWNFKQPISLLALSILFTVFAFQLPVASLIAPVENLLNIDNEVQTLAEQVDILKEEEIISEDEAKTLKEELKQLSQDSLADDPMKAWEAMDHIAASTRQKAEEASEQSIKELEQMSSLESIAELLASPAGQSLDKSTMNASMKELARMMKESAEQAKTLKNFLSKDLMQAIKAGNLSPKDLAQIQQSLAQSQKGLQESITRMIENKMLDPRKMKMVKGARKKSMKKLQQYLKQNCRNKEVCEGLGSCNKPGQGGINRGRGDADLTYKDPSDISGSKYKPVILPPGQMTDIRSSMQLAISYAEPDTDGSENSKSGALSKTKAAGGAGHKHTVLPKHKKMLKEYFNRER